MPPTNTAAWQVTTKAKTYEVKTAPYTPPLADQIVIRNGAVAINPMDWIKQEMGSMMFSWIKYPFIFGADVAGEVVEVGKDVTRYKVGDRVLGNSVGIDEKYNSAAHGTFQTYVVLLDRLTSPIPDHMSYEAASVLPLGVSTAACGLFQEDQLNLQYPSLSPTPTGKTLLVWGGSTSIGSNAIQLAVAAGYEVITTASPKNFDYVKRLGASQAFDYGSKTVVEDLIRAFEGKTIAGAFSVGHGSIPAINACMDVLDKSTGNKFLSMASYPLPASTPKHLPMLVIGYTFASWGISHWLKEKSRQIQSKFIFGSSLAGNAVGKAVYVDYLPQALAQGKYIAAPDPYVVGKGLENIQEALGVQKKGVSAAKVVVSM